MKYILKDNIIEGVDDIMVFNIKIKDVNEILNKI